MLDAIYSRRDPLFATPIRVAIVVSLLVHVALVLELPQLRLLQPGPSEQPERDSPLTVRLAPPFFAPPASPSSPSPSPAPRMRLRPPPPALALDPPAPGSPSPPPVPSVTAPTPPVTAGDLLAYVEARRLARADPSPPDSPSPRVESDNSRASRIAAANLATQRPITFGYDPSRSGGVFQMERMAHDHAEFIFVGWNSDIRRRTKQLVEVRKGNNSDIRIAVVRRMIAIIRELEPVEFGWDSQRLGRSVMLSSLMRDNAGLEEFMMREFFEVKP